VDWETIWAIFPQTHLRTSLINQQLVLLVSLVDCCQMYQSTYFNSTSKEGCQMVYFQKKIVVGYILEDPAMKDICLFLAIWSILRPFSLFYGHLVYFVVIWYI
jgi:hypothetical protein